jgi:hypothetical protein
LTFAFTDAGPFGYLGLAVVGVLGGVVFFIWFFAEASVDYVV